MASTIEYLALGVVIIVLVVAVVQAFQLTGLNDKIAQQNTALVTLAGSSPAASNTGVSATSSQTQQQTSNAGSQMVGGC